jgi:hypothetical protein
MPKYDEQYGTAPDQSAATPEPSIGQIAAAGETGLRGTPLNKDVVLRGMERAKDEDLQTLLESPALMSDPDFKDRVEGLARERGLLREAQPQAETVSGLEGLEEPEKFNRYVEDFVHGPLRDAESFVKKLVTEGPKQPQVVTSMLDGMQVAPMEDGSMRVESLIQTEKTEQEAFNTTAAQSILEDKSRKLEDSIAEARKVLQQNPITKTVAEIYANKVLNISPAESVGAEIITAIDENVTQKENRNIQAAIIHDDPEVTWDDALDKRNDDVKAALINLRDVLVSFVGGDQEKLKELVDKGAFGGKGSVTSNVATNMMPEYMARARAKYGDDLSKFEPSTMRDFIEFIDPVPYDDSMDIDAMDFFRGVFSGDEQALVRWQDQMENNYGPYWQVRYTSFLAKEIGVDAAILAAGTYLAPAAFAARGAPIYSDVFSIAGHSPATTVAKLRAALVRATAVGVGGSSVQMGIKTILGEDHSFWTDSAFRGAGFLAADAIFHGAGKLAGGLMDGIFRSSKSFAEKANLKIRTPEQMRRISDSVINTSSHFASLVRASILKTVGNNEFSKVAGGIARSLDPNTKIDPKITPSIQEMLNMPADEARVFLPAASKALPEIHVETPAAGTARQELLVLEQGIEKIRKNMARSKREATIARQQKDLEALELAKSEKEAFIKTQVSTTTGNPMADLILQGQALGLRIMGEGTLPNGTKVALRTTNQKGINDLFLTYMKSDEFQYRPETAWNGTTLGRITDWSVTEPDKYPFAHIAKDVFDAINEESGLRATLNQAYKKIYKGLNGKQQQAVGDLLDEGAAAERVFNVDELLMRGHSQKVIDSYYAARKTLDMAHYLYDRALVRGLKAKVDKGGRPIIMKYKDRVVQVNRYVQEGQLKADDVNKGLVYIEEVPAHAQTKYELFKGKVSNAELRELDSVLPTIRGYVPIVYENANYHITKINMMSGMVERLSVNKSYREAFEAAQKISPTLSENEVLVYNSWNQLGQESQVGFFNRAHTLAEMVPNKEVYEQIKRGLEASGVGENNVRIVLENMDATTLRRHHVGMRSERLPHLEVKDGQLVREDAPLLPANQAIAEYLQTVAQKGGSSNWRRYLIDQFLSRYERILDPTKVAQVKEGLLPFYDRSIFQDIKVGITGSNIIDTEQRQALLKEAKFFQKWAETMVTEKTARERALDNWYDAWDQRLQQSNSLTMRALNDFFLTPWKDKTTLSKGLSWLTLGVTNRPFSSEFNNIMRGVASVPKLRLLNLAQILVQGFQGVVTASMHPMYATRAAADMLALSMRRVYEWGTFGKGTLPKALSGELDQTYFAIKRSGYLSDLDTNDLMHSMKPVARGTLDKIGQGFNEVSGAPFKIGEATNRLMAFLVTRRQYMDMAKDGTLLGLDGKQFKGAIDDDEFLRLVTDKAKVIAFNMGKAGQLQGLKGANSVIFQFKQVGFKFVNMFTTDQLTVAEKARAAAGLFALWGIDAIPFVSDLIVGADWVQSVFNNKPTDRQILQDFARESTKTAAAFLAEMTPEQAKKEWGIDAKFYERLAKKGLVNALTDGEVDIASRVALGNFVSQMTEMSTNPMDMVVATSVISDMVAATNNVIGSGLVNVASFLELMSAVATGGEESFTKKFEEIYDMKPKGAIAKVMREYGKAASMLGSISNFVDNAHGTMWEGTANVWMDKRNVNPFFRNLDPNETNFFTTSSMRRTGVEVTQGRLAQRLFGLTPGPLKEEYDIFKEEERFKNALISYRQDQLARYRNLPPSSDERDEIRAETFREIGQFRIMLDGMLADGKIQQPFTKQTLDMFLQEDLKVVGSTTKVKYRR